ncbi:hypothetical protein BKA67DRAFT_529072 [Truncatella angustata]|uniref:Uncharacterized protein n=1 Tax=Truncatella angustata TaxID=152316 RepID=A0A9P8UVL4_9PEZI|nr:uncharacterized protein BKA67DRAFT_529072 [Truncatella angustata]KAH6658881.1 hypothetical protein BKA67DRAFT_529072 [Truncatella angustata]
MRFNSSHPFSSSLPWNTAVRNTIILTLLFLSLSLPLSPTIVFVASVCPAPAHTADTAAISELRGFHDFLMFMIYSVHTCAVPVGYVVAKDATLWLRVPGDSSAPGTNQGAACGYLLLPVGACCGEDCCHLARAVGSKAAGSGLQTHAAGVASHLQGSLWPEHRELDDHTFWFLFFDSALAWQGLEAAEKEIGRQQFAISTPTASEENFATATIHGSQAGTNEIAEFHPPRYPAKLCRALPASTSTTSNPSTATSTTKPHAHLQCHEPFEG